MLFRKKGSDTASITSKLNENMLGSAPDALLSNSESHLPVEELDASKFVDSLFIPLKVEEWDKKQSEFVDDLFLRDDEFSEFSDIQNEFDKEEEELEYEDENNSGYRPR